MTRATIIRPGYLVSLRTQVTGGRDYARKDLERGREDTGEQVSRWETTCKIADPEEYERVQKARAEASRLIRNSCAITPFGLLCSVSAESDLDKAISEAKALVSACNAKSAHSMIVINVLKGRIADNDVEAARAIGVEVRGMLDEMGRAIDKLDPAAIRDAATRAKQMARMLAPEQAAKVTDAIKAAREAAKAIVKRVEGAGEEGAVVLDNLMSERAVINAARFDFLDLEDSAPIEQLPSVNVQRFDDLEDATDETKPRDPTETDATDGTDAREVLAAMPTSQLEIEL